MSKAQRMLTPFGEKMTQKGRGVIGCNDTLVPTVNTVDTSSILSSREGLYIGLAKPLRRCLGGNRPLDNAISAALRRPRNVPRTLPAGCGVSGWDEAIRRIGNGEPVPDVLDERQAADNAEFREWLVTQGNAESLARYDAAMRDLDLGLTGARNAWHSISSTQRRVLGLMEAGRWLVRLELPKLWYAASGPKDSISNVCRRPAVRNLARRGLIAWDGGAFDPEARAVLTEHGRFVLRHGRAA